MAHLLSAYEYRVVDADGTPHDDGPWPSWLKASAVSKWLNESSEGNTSWRVQRRTLAWEDYPW